MNGIRPPQRPIQWRLTLCFGLIVMGGYHLIHGSLVNEHRPSLGLAIIELLLALWLYRSATRVPRAK